MTDMTHFKGVGIVLLNIIDGYKKKLIEKSVLTTQVVDKCVVKTSLSFILLYRFILSCMI